MAVARLVATNGATYRVIDAADLRTDALAVAHVVGVGALASITAVRAITPRTSAHLASGGWLVICGDPAIACPDLATIPYTFDVELTARGRLLTVSVTVPAASTPPFTATDVEIAHVPVALAGTVRRRAFPHTGIGGATVTVSGPHPAGDIVGLRTELAAAHDATTTVQARSSALGASFTLVDDAPGGSTEIPLNTVAGLAPGSLLSLSGGELVFVDSLDAVNDLAATRLPLRRTLTSGTVIREATLGAPSGSSPLTRPAIVGDGLLVTAAPLGGPVVEIVDADPDRIEVRAVGTPTDADGRYRIAGVRGVDAVSLTFAATGFITLGPDSHPLDPRLDPTTVDAELAV